MARAEVTSPSLAAYHFRADSESARSGIAVDAFKV
jgi:hypothetical protein